MSKKLTFSCLSCKKEHTTLNKYSNKNLFCSIQCQQDYLMDERVKSGKAKPRTLKKFLIRNHGNKCWTCGILEWNNKPIVMELEHIDGNSENNDLKNLSLICPNCHSQTPTYKAKNVGKGRHSRRMRYAAGKSF